MQSETRTESIRVHAPVAGRGALVTGPAGVLRVERPVHAVHAVHAVSRLTVAPAARLAVLETYEEWDYERGAAGPVSAAEARHYRAHLGRRLAAHAAPEADRRALLDGDGGGPSAAYDGGADLCALVLADHLLAAELFDALGSADPGRWIAAAVDRALRRLRPPGRAEALRLPAGPDAAGPEPETPGPEAAALAGPPPRAGRGDGTGEGAPRPPILRVTQRTGDDLVAAVAAVGARLRGRIGALRDPGELREALAGAVDAALADLAARIGLPDDALRLGRRDRVEGWDNAQLDRVRDDLAAAFGRQLDELTAALRAARAGRDERMQPEAARAGRDERTKPEAARARGDERTKPEPARAGRDERATREPARGGGEERTAGEPERAGRDDGTDPDPSARDAAELPAAPGRGGERHPPSYGRQPLFRPQGR